MAWRSATASRGTEPRVRSHWIALIGIAIAAIAAAEPAPIGPGEALYEQHCRACHGATLQGSAHGTPLRGEGFLGKWGGRSRQALLAYNLSAMPPGGARLGEAEHVVLVDFLFARNDATGDNLPGAVLVPAQEDSAVDSWSGVAGIDKIARSRSALPKPAPRSLRAGLRRPSARSAAGGLAALAPDPGRSGAQPTNPNRPHQCEPAAIGLGRDHGATAATRSRPWSMTAFST